MLVNNKHIDWNILGLITSKYVNSSRNLYQMSKTLLHLAVILGLLTITQACSTTTDDIEIDHNELAQKAIEDYESYRLRLNLQDSHQLEFPSPVELAKSYKGSGIEFIPGLANSAKNSERYITNTKKSLNFGVYSADLSYCVLNDQGQCASEYFFAIQNISNSIGLSEIFKYELIMTDFNKSLGDRDSLSKIVSGIQNDLDKTLRANGSQDKAILFYVGAWIESAYIAMNATPNFSNIVDTASVRQLSSQIDMLSEILEEFDKMEDKNQEVESLQQRLIDFQSTTETVRFKSANDSIIINPMDLQKVKAKVNEIRTFVVS